MPEVLAEREAALARDDANAFNEFLLEDLIGAASPDRDGHTVTVVSAIERSLGSIDRRFENRPAAGARVRGSIGNVYHALGLLDESLVLTERAVRDHEAEFGPDAPSTILTRTGLATVLHHMGRGSEAESIARETLSRAEASLEPDDPALLVAKGVLGEILQADGKHDEAQPLLRSSIVGMRRTLPPVRCGRRH